MRAVFSRLGVKKAILVFLSFLAVGVYSACDVDGTTLIDSSLFQWGWPTNNAASQVTAATPANCTAKQWRSIAVGGSENAAICNGRLYRLPGNGSPVQIGTDSDWSRVVAGNNHFLALKEDRTLWSWGDNSNGQLGTYNRTSATEPQGPISVYILQNGLVHVTEWLSIAAGDRYSLAVGAVGSSGALFSWGRSGEQLGTGSYYSTLDQEWPRQIGSDLGWESVAAGGSHSLATKNCGADWRDPPKCQLWSWGDNFYGQLGDGTRQARNEPVRIGANRSWSRSLAGGTWHSLAISSGEDGKNLFAWGLGVFGQLGGVSATDCQSGSTGSPNLCAPNITQVPVGGDWQSVAAGAGHSLAMKVGGDLYASGSNSNYQLGDGTISSRSNFTGIDVGRQWNAISARGNRSAGLSFQNAIRKEVISGTSYNGYYKAPVTLSWRNTFSTYLSAQATFFGGSYLDSRTNSCALNGQSIGQAATAPLWSIMPPYRSETLFLYCGGGSGDSWTTVAETKQDQVFYSSSLRQGDNSFSVAARQHNYEWGTLSSTKASDQDAEWNFKVDKTGPTLSLDLSDASGNTYIGQNNRLYISPKSGNSGSYRLNATASDPETGVKNALMPAPTGMSGGGTVGAAPYSRTYSWSGAIAAAGEQTITANNNLDIASSSSYTVTSDTLAPQLGALTVNGLAASSSGTLSSNTSGQVSITRINYNEEESTSQSGLLSSTLVRRSGVLENGSCIFPQDAESVVLPGAAEENNLSTGCYRYILTGLDRVGNKSEISTTVRVDRSAPRDGFLQVNDTAATAEGSFSLTKNNSLAINRLDFWIDPDSGMSTTPGAQLVRRSATFTNNNCGTFGQTRSGDGAINISSTPLLQSSLANACYKYTLAGVNQFGQGSAVETTVRLDSTVPVAPTLTLSQASGQTHLDNSNKRVYLNPQPGNGGSFTLAGQSSDPDSGIENLSFPGIGGFSSGGSERITPGSSGSVVYSWQGDVSSSAGEKDVVAKNNVLATNKSPFYLIADSSAPTGGSLTIGGKQVPSGQEKTASFYSSSTNIVLSERQYFQESASTSQSGLASSTLRRQSATLQDGACQAFSDDSEYTAITTPPPFTHGSAQGIVTGKCYKYLLAAEDRVSNKDEIAVVALVDDTGPTGGGFQVNNTEATSAGSSSWSATGAFSLDSQTDYIDSQSGILESSFIRQSANLVNGSCQDFGQSRAGDGQITSSLQSGLASACYRYVLSATNRAGITSSKTALVLVDRGGIVLDPAEISTATGSTAGSGNVAWIRPGDNRSGSFLVTIRPSDTQSGIASVLFPDVLGMNGGGQQLTSPYSKTYSWSGDVASNGPQKIVVQNNVNRQESSFFFIYRDTTRPSLSLLATDNSQSGNFTIRYEAQDNQSGLANTSLTRQSAALTEDGSCASYGLFSTTLGASPLGQSLSPGCYRYKLQATDRVGNQATIYKTVRVDPTRPVINIDLSGTGDSYAREDTLWLNAQAGRQGVFTLKAQVGDPLDIASVFFPDLQGMSGGGDLADPPYQMNYSWSGDAPSAGEYSVVANNKNDENSAAAFKIRIDTNPPLSSLFLPTVDSDGNFLINYSARDRESGLQELRLTRERGEWSGSSCGSYQGEQTVGQGPISESLDPGCYRYKFVARDRVGNEKIITRVVRVDPENIFVDLTLSDAQGNTALDSDTVWVASGEEKEGSFSVDVGAREDQLGVESVLFPTLANTLGGGLVSLAPYKTTYSWQGERGGSLFQCRLDGGQWQACSPEKAYSNLAEGLHTFAVRKITAAGEEIALNSRTWYVDRTAPPAPRLVTTPAEEEDSSQASFSWIGREAGGLFECRLDLATWERCSSEIDYTDLADGEHTFQVRQFDAAGNRSVASQFVWSVENTVPKVQSFIRTWPDSSPTGEESLSYSIVFSESVSGFDAEDIEIGGTASWQFSVYNVSGSGSSYTFDLIKDSETGRDGTVIPRILPRSVQSPGGTLAPVRSASAPSTTVQYNPSDIEIIPLPSSAAWTEEDDTVTAKMTFLAIGSNIPQEGRIRLDYQNESISASALSGPGKSNSPWSLYLSQGLGLQGLTVGEYSVELSGLEKNKDFTARPSFILDATEDQEEQVAVYGQDFAFQSLPLPRIENTRILASDQEFGEASIAFDLIDDSTNPLQNSRSTSYSSLYYIAFDEQGNPVTETTNGQETLLGENMITLNDLDPSQTYFVLPVASYSLGEPPDCPEGISSFACGLYQAFYGLKVIWGEPILLFANEISPLANASVVERNENSVLLSIDIAAEAIEDDSVTAVLCKTPEEEEYLLVSELQEAQPGSNEIFLENLEPGQRYLCRFVLASGDQDGDYERIYFYPEFSEPEFSFVTAGAVDLVPPVLSDLTRASDQMSPTNNNQIFFQFSSNKRLDETTITADDFIVTNGDFLSVSGGPRIYRLAVEAQSDGQVSIEPSDNFSVFDLEGAGQEEISLSEERSVIYDSIAPEFTIDFSPEALSTSAQALFVFSASEIVLFQCRLDEGPWRECANVEFYDQLEEGEHTFYLRASDPAGNSGEEKSYSWTVDKSTTLDPAIISGPAGIVADSQASFAWQQDNVFYGKQEVIVKDSLGKEERVSFDLIADNSPPLLTIGVGQYSSSGSYSINYKASDADSGIESVDFVRQKGVLENNTCSAWEGEQPLDSNPASETDLESGCYRYTIVAKDRVGNSLQEQATVRVDRSGPLGGELSAPAYSKSGTFSLQKTNYTIDPQTGVVSNVLQKRSAPLEDGACQAYGAWEITLEEQDNLATACYQYRLLAKNAAGTSSSVMRTTRVDRSDPLGGSISPLDPYSISGSFAINFSEYSDPHSGMKSNILERQAATLSNGSCATPGAWSAVAAQQTDLLTGCYWYRLRGVNRADGESISQVIGPIRVDRSDPLGGDISSPEWSKTGTFTVSLVPFTDPHSDMETNVVEVRASAFGQSGCGSYGSWQTSTSEQNNLPEGCYQYRLRGSNKAGSSAITGPLEKSTTRVDRQAPLAAWSGGPASITKDSQFNYTLKFTHGGLWLENVIGLASPNSQIVNAIPSASGGASGCQFSLSTGGATGIKEIVVTNCSDGEFKPRLLAGAVEDGAKNGNTQSDGNLVLIDRTKPDEPPCIAIGGNCSGPGTDPGEPSETSGVSGCVAAPGGDGDNGWVKKYLDCYVYVTENYVPGTNHRAPKLSVSESWGAALQEPREEEMRFYDNLAANKKRYLAQFSLSTQRKDIYLKLRAIDQAGNTSALIDTSSGPYASAAIQIDRRDPLAPSVSGNNCSDGSISWENAPWAQSATCLFADVEDSPNPESDRLSGEGPLSQVSGVDRYQYRVCYFDPDNLSAAEECGSRKDAGGASFSPEEEGLYRIYLNTKDRAGNTSDEVSKALKIDRTAPINIRPGPGDRVYLSEEGFLAEVEARDYPKDGRQEEGGNFSSGFAALECRVSDESTGASQVIAVAGRFCSQNIRDDDLVLEWRASDQLGNVGAWRKIDPKIDMARPRLVVDNSHESTWTDEQVEIKVTATDPLPGKPSGIEEIEASITYPGGSSRELNIDQPSEEIVSNQTNSNFVVLRRYQFDEEIDARIKFVAKDFAGRKSRPVYTSVKIDRTAPEDPGAVLSDSDIKRWTGEVKITSAAAGDPLLSSGQAGSGQVRGELWVCDAGSCQSSQELINHEPYDFYLPKNKSLGRPCSSAIESEGDTYACWIDANRLPVAPSIPMRIGMRSVDRAGNRSDIVWREDLQSSGRMCALN